MNSVMKADFYGCVLYGSRIGDAVYVALKPIVEAMGIEWSAQYRRVMRDPVLKEGIAIMAIPSARGGTQDSVGLKLDLLPGWLFTISALRVRSAEIRRKIIIFQRECYDVLAAQFLGKTPQPATTPTYRQQSLGVRMAREARLLFGKRAGAEVWREQGLPWTLSMTEPAHQPDLFEWSKRRRKKA